MDMGQSYDFLTILRDKLNVNVVHYEVSSVVEIF